MHEVLTLEDMCGVPIKVTSTQRHHSFGLITYTETTLDKLQLKNIEGNLPYEPGTTLNRIMHFILSYYMKVKNVQFRKLDLPVHVAYCNKICTWHLPIRANYPASPRSASTNQMSQILSPTHRQQTVLPAERNSPSFRHKEMLLKFA
jgi:hypothetical protein